MRGDRVRELPLLGPFSRVRRPAPTESAHLGSGLVVESFGKKVCVDGCYRPTCPVRDFVQPLRDAGWDARVETDELVRLVDARARRRAPGPRRPDLDPVFLPHRPLLSCPARPTHDRIRRSVASVGQADKRRVVGAPRAPRSRAAASPRTSYGQQFQTRRPDLHVTRARGASHQASAVSGLT